jgi:hypothetical protein
MRTFKNTDYYPSGTWNQFLHNLHWKQTSHIDSAYTAFKEAIRRGISRAEAFFDVAEAIHRSYCGVNWGLLNWNWKLALQHSNHARRSASPTPTPKAPPPPPSFQRSVPPGKGNGAADHQGQHNGIARHNGNGYHNVHNEPKVQQRRAASLISYYP